MATKLDLFEDLAGALDYWTALASEALTNRDTKLDWVEDDVPYREIQNAFATAGVSDATVAKVLSECLRGYCVSLLTALDGGTALADKGRIYLIDERGNHLGEGLHDDFVGYLMDTGRLT